MRFILKKKVWLIVILALVSGAMFTVPLSYAKSAREIDASVDDSLDRFKREVEGSSNLLAQAKGVLVFPRVIKAGIGLGGEYGFFKQGYACRY